ncbi:hypothetical protein BJ741DRAFT_606302, partial [Chytriomyces cf. hyalinus JEL632]
MFSLVCGCAVPFALVWGVWQFPLLLSVGVQCPLLLCGGFGSSLCSCLWVCSALCSCVGGFGNFLCSCVCSKWSCSQQL